MAIQLSTVAILHERRYRLVFTEAVNGSAFSSLTPFSVVSVSGNAAAPSPVALFAVLGAANMIEVQLSLDLVPGVIYTFFANAVPAAGGGSTPNPSSVQGAFGQLLQSPVNHEGDASELEVLLYGRDLVFRDGEFVEQGNDLATIAGVPNVDEALRRRGLAAGLPWAPSYGLHAIDFVDGTAAAIVGLQGRALSQFLEDDRVASVEASIDFGTGDVNSATLTVTPKLIGDLGGTAASPQVIGLK